MATCVRHILGSVEEPAGRVSVGAVRSHPAFNYLRRFFWEKRLGN